MNTYREIGQPCLVPDFRRIASRYSPFKLMLAIGLPYIAFIIFRYEPFIPDLYKIFIMKWCWNLSKTLSASNVMIMWVFLQFAYIVDYTEELSCVEPSLHYRNKANLGIVDDVFYVFLD